MLDLSETDYLDSSGVRLIFELAERLGSRGQKLELVVPDDSVIKRVLVLTEVSGWCRCSRRSTPRCRASAP